MAIRPVRSIGDVPGLQAALDNKSATTHTHAAFDSPTLAVDSTNHRVGVGTASPGAKFVIESSGTNLPFEIRKDGVLYQHAALVDGSTHGFAWFGEGTYIAVKNVEANQNPQIRISNSPASGVGSINAFDDAVAATKHQLHLKASGAIWMWPTNGDPIRVVNTSLQPYDTGTGSLGAATKRWGNAHLAAITVEGVAGRAGTTTFTTADGKTVTVVGGIITAIV